MLSDSYRRSIQFFFFFWCVYTVRVCLCSVRGILPQVSCKPFCRCWSRSLPAEWKQPPRSVALGAEPPPQAAWERARCLRAKYGVAMGFGFMCMYKYIWPKEAALIFCCLVEPMCWLSPDVSKCPLHPGVSQVCPRISGAALRRLLSSRQC